MLSFCIVFTTKVSFLAVYDARVRRDLVDVAGMATKSAPEQELCAMILWASAQNQDDAHVLICIPPIITSNYLVRRFVAMTCFNDTALYSTCSRARDGENILPR